MFFDLYYLKIEDAFIIIAEFDHKYILFALNV